MVWSVVTVSRLQLVWMISSANDSLPGGILIWYLVFLSVRSFSAYVIAVKPPFIGHFAVLVSNGHALPVVVYLVQNRSISARFNKRGGDN